MRVIVLRLDDRFFNNLKIDKKGTNCSSWEAYFKKRMHTYSWLKK